MARNNSGPTPIDRALGFTSRTQAVYVMSIEGGPVKIGRSRDPGPRCQGIQVGNDRVVFIYWAIRMAYADANKIEKLTQKRLKRDGFHTRGEWFIVDPQYAVGAILDEIKRLKIRAVSDLLFGIDRI